MKRMDVSHSTVRIATERMRRRVSVLARVLENGSTVGARKQRLR